MVLRSRPAFTCRALPRESPVFQLNSFRPRRRGRHSSAPRGPSIHSDHRVTHHPDPAASAPAVSPAEPAPIALDAPDLAASPFRQLGLSPQLVRAVLDEGYTIPTPVQEQVIPAALAGATSSPARRPAPARPPRSSLPILQVLARGAAHRARSARSSSPRRASSRRRSPSASRPTAGTSARATRSSTAASASTGRRSRCAARPTCSSPRPAACSTS